MKNKTDTDYFIHNNKITKAEKDTIDHYYMIDNDILCSSSIYPIRKSLRKCYEDSILFLYYPTLYHPYEAIPSL